MLTIAPIFEKSEHEEVQVFDPAYFTSDHSWSLLSFLFYRQQQSDFQFDKKKEHARYIRNLSNILKRKQVNETIANLAESALATFQWTGLRDDSSLDGITICIQPPTLPDYDRDVMIYSSWWFCPDFSLMPLPKEYCFLLAVTNAIILLNRMKRNHKHTTGVANSVFQQDQVVREKYMKRLNNTDFLEGKNHSASNGHDVSDTGIHEDEVENPFITNYEEGSRNNNKWVADGHNISLDFREFQLTSINLLETNQTFSYAKDIDRILCLSSIMYCNEVKLEFVTCSEKVWNKIRPRPLVPKMLPSVVQLIIIEYNMFLNDKQLLNIKWHENWVKWSILSTDEDKSIFDCAQEVTKNL
ncbi:hypothetical protein GLOIN_2v1477923 [Rhizophagus irregularis DAOM 181602=DAOM 197198]|uniref:Uncharacterized protein n=1 Tax=Rhizophagus irregularis (strain DAOM 181602 / DAOM 197198 / MUCL 43194) TaxID=747089 RepID=A0A2P4Q3A3_RHIID|nr:hypothetical protein GLOIN_2v1477923 [Rhizophagus irregularis DAOM 181602=DAOM 197198]POG72127.1 hypothetical protein GLOIN_2v1477923 [Rhizophagus irregularis DAOM 181602=DAOM 197198]|eukprot:XP_025178993.1 hypothetical protein GLOIN_2v1477923 [Rhizophagus irregularis DAOM 181602=DAOM 197198]